MEYNYLWWVSELASNKVFALEERTEGKKVKQVPVIRRKD